MKRTSEILKRFNDAQDSLVLQASDLSLESISNMATSGAINVQPRYQRRERWDATKQSALVESFLLNIPVPPIYLFEEDYGTYSAIDGRQRIQTIKDFMSGRLQLRGLEAFEELEGATFEQLPESLQNALRVRPYVRVVTLLRQSSAALKYEVFTRLNTQGVPLNAQEIRNVIFRGDLNDTIYDLAGNTFLQHQLKIKSTKSAAYQSMADAEYVLRFLALHEDMASFRESFRRSMDEYMRRHKTDGPRFCETSAALFKNAIAHCERIWGEQAFRRATAKGWRDQFLAGMYDAQMLGVASTSEDALTEAASKAEHVRRRTKALFEDDPEFDRAVREGTNTKARLRYRVDKIVELLTTA